MTRRGCGHTVIPEVDNTEEVCEKYITDECIIFREVIPYLGTTEDSSLREIILQLVEKIKDQSKILKRLRVEMANIKKNR